MFGVDAPITSSVWTVSAALGSGQGGGQGDGQGGGQGGGAARVDVLAAVSAGDWGERSTVSADSLAATLAGDGAGMTYRWPSSRWERAFFVWSRDRERLSRRLRRLGRVLCAEARRRREGGVARVEFASRSWHIEPRHRYAPRAPAQPEPTLVHVECTAGDSSLL